MYTKPTTRNMSGIQHEFLRKKVDNKFNIVHDDLSDCYYNFWKEGKSKEFKVGLNTFNKMNTPEESKQLFDKLHGLIFHEYKVKFHEENLKQDAKDKISEDKYNAQDSSTYKTPVEDSQAVIDSMKTQGIELGIDGNS